MNKLKAINNNNSISSIGGSGIAYSNEISILKNELKKLTGTNKKGRINDLNDQLNKYNKELKQIEAVNKDEIILVDYKTDYVPNNNEKYLTKRKNLGNLLI